MYDTTMTPAGKPWRAICKGGCRRFERAYFRTKREATEVATRHMRYGVCREVTAVFNERRLYAARKGNAA